MFWQPCLIEIRRDYEDFIRGIITCIARKNYSCEINSVLVMWIFFFDLKVLRTETDTEDRIFLGG